MERPPTGQLGHTCIYVADIDKTVHLYHELLGMPLVERRKAEPPARSVAIIGSAHNYLEVFDRRADEVPPPPPSVPQALPLNHFSIWVENLLALETKLAAAGYPFTGPIRQAPKWVGGRLQVGWIVDPDGNRVELLEWLGPAEA